MVLAPASDADVPRLVADLGIPGLVDIHTHFMPQNVLEKVWAYFDRHGTGIAWDIAYRLDETQRVARLRQLGVVAYTSLFYPHKPDMAAWLNSWGEAFASRHPDCVHSATFYPEAGVAEYVAKAIEDGARVFKVHLVVGDYDPWDPLLHDVWALIERARLPVVVHAGSYPEPTRWSGARRFGEVLAAHPELVAVIAHMGAPEFEDLWWLGLRYPNVRFDTTMAFTDFWAATNPFPTRLLRDVGDHPERIVLGSDFPNIPHPYAHQLEALVRLGFGEDWLRAVLHDNGHILLGGSAP